MKLNPLASALLLLLAVAVRLPAQTRATNAPGTNAPSLDPYLDLIPKQQPKPGATNPGSVPANAFGFVPDSTNQSATNSLDQLRALANSGDAGAQYRLGEVYDHRLDRAEAAKWYRLAADQGNADAQHELGLMYSLGLGVERDDAEAAKWYRKAKESYRKAAEKGDAEAQIKLGDAYQSGYEGVAKDFTEAVNWYRKAADQGNAHAQYTLGGAYRYGWGVATNDAQAVNWYRKAAENGDAGAQHTLADAYSHGGLGVATNFAEAVIWYRKAAEQGVADAQNTLGDAYRYGRMGLVTNFAEAVKWYRKSADQGNADAQYSLGSCYSAGQGVPQDPVEANNWYQKAAEFHRKVAEAMNKYFVTPQLEAAERGDVQAQLSLAYNLKTGSLQKKDPKEAARWYRAAAEQGDAKGQWSLGEMYADGDGIDPDPAEAVRFLAKAAEQGDADYQSMLAYRYFKGKGIVQDYANAAKWYRRAAEQGDAGSQATLGLMYDLGKGVPKDYVQAYKWYNLAAAQNGPTEIASRDAISSFMTPTQIAEGQRLSREFVVRKEGRASNRADGKDSDTAAATPRFTGTGFFVTDDGYLLTCYHVVQDAGRIVVRTKAGTFAGKLVKSDKANDIALLKVAGKFATLPVGLSRRMKLGESVFTIGFPNIELQGFAPKLTKGEISSLTGVQDDPREFQISVAVQPGNSGGPLVNQYGNVVGIVAAKLADMATLETTGSLPQNVNYAVKSSVLNVLLESLPEISAKLIEPHPAKDRQFDDVEKETENAAALVLVY